MRRVRGSKCQAQRYEPLQLDSGITAYRDVMIVTRDGKWVSAAHPLERKDVTWGRVLYSGVSAMANEKMSDASTQTPVMRQYFAAKEAHPDCLMFCRIGDFYELFYEDAIVASRELQLTLTARDREKKQPMCGVPYHAAEQYIQRLLRKGYRVALCD